MDIKKNKGWIFLLVVLAAWEIFTIASIKSQNENLERQINNMANNIHLLIPPFYVTTPLLGYL